MKTQSQSARAVDRRNQQAARAAWCLWHQLDRLAASLWEMYEDQFMAFCEEEARDNVYARPAPSDPDPPF